MDLEKCTKKTEIYILVTLITEERKETVFLYLPMDPTIKDYSSKIMQKEIMAHIRLQNSFTQVASRETLSMVKDTKKEQITISMDFIKMEQEPKAF